MPDIATLELRVESGQVVQGDAALKSLTTSAAGAEATAQRLRTAFGPAGAQIASSMQTARQATQVARIGFAEFGRDIGLMQAELIRLTMQQKANIISAQQYKAAIDNLTASFKAEVAAVGQIRAQQAFGTEITALSTGLDKAGTSAMVLASRMPQMAHGMAGGQKGAALLSFGLFNLASAGDLSAHSIKNMAFGTAMLAPQFTMFILAVVGVVEVLALLGKAHEKAAEAAKKHAEDEVQAWQHILHAFERRPTLTDPQRIAAATQQLATYERLLVSARAAEAALPARPVAIMSERALTPLNEGDIQRWVALSTAAAKTTKEWLDRVTELRNVINDSRRAMAEDTARAAHDYLEGLRNEVANLGLVGAALERNVALQHHYGTAVAETAAGLRRRLDVAAQIRAAEERAQSDAAKAVTDASARVQGLENLHRATQAMVDVTNAQTKASIEAGRAAKEADLEAGKRMAAEETKARAIAKAEGKGLLGFLTQLVEVRGVSDLFALFAAIPGIGMAAKGAAGIFQSLAGALFGGGAAAEQARRRYAELREELMRAITAFGDVLMPSLAQQMAAVHREADALRQQTNAAFGNIPSAGGGMTPKQVAALNEITRLEALRIAQLQAQAQEMNRLLREDLDVRMLRARGLDEEADAMAFALQQQREYADAVKAGADRVTLAKLAHVQAAEAIARTMEGLKNTIAGLKSFTDSLRLDTGLTTLSPMQQLAEARRQYETVLAAAQGGDQAAAGRLPEVARAFLTASRAVNASGMGYARDFAQVVRETEAVQQMFQDQLSIQEQMLDALLELVRLATPHEIGGPGGPSTGDPRKPWFPPAVEANLTATLGEVQTAVAMLGAGFTMLVAEQQAVRVAIEEGTATTVRKLEGLALN